MNISPRRRRRIFHEHTLRQAGHTLEQIANQVNVSIATVHADLRLLEEHWVLLTQDIHDDLLLQQVARLDQRLERLTGADPIDQARRALGPDAQLTFEQLTQIEDRHARRLAQVERELRMLLKQLNIPHIYSSMRSPDHPDDEFADHETDRKNLKEPETIPDPIPSKTLEIVAPHPSEKSSAETLKPPLPSPNGRNQPCPCGSGQERKHCHPQNPKSHPLGEARPALDAGMSRQPSNSPPLGEARPALDAGMSRRPSKSPPLREMSRSDRGGLPPSAGDTEALPTDFPDKPLPPGAEAEALRLTDEHQAAKQRGDALAELNALEKIVALYNP